LTFLSHHEAAPLLPLVGLPTDKLHREMTAHAPNYDHIIIDAPPQVSSIARPIILAADLILSTPNNDNESGQRLSRSYDCSARPYAIRS
jgi:cellulose biosynthesis protein BcsQ